MSDKEPDAEPTVKEATISAVVHRADGTVEDLGIISRGPIEFKAEGGSGGEDK